MLNIAYAPKQENLEGRNRTRADALKLYYLDQVTESLITSNFTGNSSVQFAYTQFLQLEQTVAELAKCYLLEFGDDKTLSYGRCNARNRLTTCTTAYSH